MRPERFLPPSGQRGTAIIMALLVAGLAAVLATATLAQMQERIDQTELERDHDRSRHLAQDALDYARMILAEDGRRSHTDHAGEHWARHLPPIEADGAIFSGWIEDMQGHFNLNNLLENGQQGPVDPAALRVCQAVFVRANVDPGLCPALADWLDQDDLPRRGGAESRDYLQDAVGHPCANRALQHPGELLHIRGFTPDVVARLSPFVSVLPRMQPVNVNTASPVLLAALLPELGPQETGLLVQQRQRLPFRDRNDFMARLPAGVTPAEGVAIGTASQHFLVHLDVRYGKARTRLQVLLQRDPAHALPVILWHMQE